MTFQMRMTKVCCISGKHMRGKLLDLLSFMFDHRATNSFVPMQSSSMLDIDICTVRSCLNLLAFPNCHADVQTTLQVNKILEAAGNARIQRFTPGPFGIISGLLWIDPGQVLRRGTPRS